ncbi:MAG TPA: hypothetical protein VIQ54_24475 [Polyangia bacterium]|jgi:hypothetical protein
MNRRPNIMTASLAAVSLAALSGISCGGGNDSAPDPVCMTLMSYTASTLTAPSFATDIMPILTSTTTGLATAPVGCSQAFICHGEPPMPIDKGETKTMKYLNTPAADVRTQLLGMAVNAPSMAIVVPGSVNNSFMAYKISGSGGLSCVTSKCQAGAGVNPITACGAPMPSNGMITDADRTKILDWIALGAMP